MAQSLFFEKDSPVEFFYLDRQRIASLATLAGQLSDHGMLVGLKSVAQKTQSKEGNAEGNFRSPDIHPARIVRFDHLG